MVVALQCPLAYLIYAINNVLCRVDSWNNLRRRKILKIANFKGYNLGTKSDDRRILIVPLYLTR